MLNIPSQDDTHTIVLHLIILLEDIFVVEYSKAQ